MANEERSNSIEVELVWVGVEDTPIAFVNHLVSQFQGSEFVLTFGQQTPPIILGTDQEKLEQAKNIKYVPIKTVVRIGLSAQRMADFVRVLQENLSRYEQQKGIENP